MRFPTVFTLADTAIPDTAPTGKPDFKNDARILACRIQNTNGHPPQRIVVLASYIGAATPSDIPCDLYFYEDSTGTWYKMNAAPVNVHPTVRTADSANPSQYGVIAYFDCPVLMDLPNTSSQAAQSPSPGAINCLLVVGTPTPTKAAGQYTFAVAADMSVSP